MIFRQRVGSTYSSTYTPTSPLPDGSNTTKVSSAYDFSWPIFVIGGIVLGCFLAFNYTNILTNIPVELHRLLVTPHLSAELEARNVLVVTANRRDQLTAVATLSPRGFQPLLASSESEVLAQISAHPRTLSLVVVDSSLPGYARIRSALRDFIPIGGIIVLNGTHGSQDIGPMLLERL
jgi:CheY-like chemotaxis protein